MTALTVKQLKYRWPGQQGLTLDVAGLSLQPGSSLFLHGPSGCGKSTLLSAIAGVIDIPPGSIEISGTDIGAIRSSARDRFRAEHIGIIFQLLNLLPWLSALDNVLLATRFSDARRVKAGPRPDVAARQLLAELGLAGPSVIDAPASSLSVGQQQRVAAARALLGMPDLVLADEPTSALDDEAKTAFVNLLVRECAAASAALLFVSHDRSLEGYFDQSLSLAQLNGSGALGC
jgi:putative ABC transport system ATP-binding protein